MLDTLFLSVLDMTKAGSLVILAVLAARLLLRRVPKAVSYALWLVVLFRLLCPVGFQSPVSLMPEIKPMAQEYDLEDQPISFAGAGMAAYQAVGDVINGGIDDQRVATDVKDDQGNTVYVSTDMGDVWILFGSYVWAAGVCGLALYSGFSFLSLKRKLREAVPQEKGVYLAGGIDSPFVMGRKIYLPDGLADRERAYILAHEQHHLRRGDPIWKALGFLALTIHWFNPLVWAAFVLGCRDMEMSCDEAVVKTFGPEIRGEYAASLLKIATGKRIIAGAPLAFGEGDPKGRIRNLAKWKKPILIVSVIAAVLCLVLGVCLLTDPVEENKDGRSLFFGALRYVEGRDLMLDCEDGRELRFLLSDGYDIPQGVEPGDTVMIRGTWQEAQGVYVTSRVTATENTETASLEQAIEAAIIGTEGIGKEPEEFACASFWTLSKQSQGIVSELSGAKKVDTVTVYGLALYHTYTCENGVLEQQSGSHIPVAITFRVTDGGEYVLTEYWMPRDGSYYAKDIRKKFPLGVVPDTQKYIDSQRAECLAKANYHFGITDGEVIFDAGKIPLEEHQLLENLPDDYTTRSAIMDGSVILENGYATYHTDTWNSFTEKVEQGTPAWVRTVVLHEGQVSYIRDILFDGTSFRARNGLFQDGSMAVIWERDYAFLQTFYRDYAMETYRSCILTNQKLQSPPSFWMHTVFSSDTGEQLVYQERMPEAETTTPTTEAVYGFDFSKVPSNGVVPLEELPEDYSLNDAVRDKVVVIDLNTVYANSSQWDSFVIAVERGTPARVRFLFSNLGVVDGWKDVLYDGESFCLLTTIYYGTGGLARIQEEYFNYLKAFRGENRLEDGTVYEQYTAYILSVRDTNQLPEHLRYGWPTEEGEQLVYLQSVTTAIYPNLPENVVSAKIMLENQVLAEVGSKSKLESLMTLLRTAEITPTVSSRAVYEPLALVLEAADGTQVRYPISPEQDLICVEGSIYDYGPGMELREGKTRHRNAILEMVRHFGLEDWPQEFRDYCIANGTEPPRHSLKVIVGEEPHN